jgi:hypothetical protein
MPLTCHVARSQTESSVAAMRSAFRNENDRGVSVQ